MKKIRRLVLFCALLIVSTTVGAYDFSAKNADGVWIYYNITSSTDLTCEVTHGLSYGYYSGVVSIPEIVSYNGKTYSVTSIGSSAFFRCYDLTSIVIPNSVTSIEHWAFEYCNYEV